VPWSCGLRPATRTVAFKVGSERVASGTRFSDIVPSEQQCRIEEIINFDRNVVNGVAGKFDETIRSVIDVARS
jgi:hypothetical protein